MKILISSFGHKHGAPPEADLVLDARHLPNPYWSTALRGYTGLDPQVQHWLKNQPGVEQFIETVRGLAMAGIRNEQKRKNGGRAYRIAFGCTGGHHRSVYCAAQLHDRFLMTPGLAETTITLTHREI